MMMVNERLAVNAPIQIAGAEQLKLIMLRLDAFFAKHRLNRTSGNLLVDYKNWFTRVVSLPEASMTEVEGELDKIETGNCKVVVLGDNDKVLCEYDRPLRLKWEDIDRLNMNLIW
jgi:hypothetical protein